MYLMHLHGHGSPRASPRQQQWQKDATSPWPPTRQSRSAQRPHADCRSGSHRGWLCAPAADPLLSTTCEAGASAATARRKGRAPGAARPRSTWRRARPSGTSSGPCSAHAGPPPSAPWTSSSASAPASRTDATPASSWRDIHGTCAPGSCRPNQRDASTTCEAASWSVHGGGDSSKGALPMLVGRPSAARSPPTSSSGTHPQSTCARSSSAADPVF
mmetsp:Transcript_13318/g.30215  ORF Transcript_13318/g.30215 Transcript_13318/m.30215 type:complete len:216 (-) Transcript_13318:187-834(-)